MDGLSVFQVEMVKATITALEDNGYQTAAEALKDVLLQEFAKMAEQLHD